MKQKPRRRKPKHRTATQPARYKCHDMNKQEHVRYRTGKKTPKTTDTLHTQAYKTE
tara:strand:+ start:405 stop:572 length:168 start_codon:yes stop_codon:yes gene_type:complete